MSLAIRKILVIDGTGAKLERATVVVDGDRIAAVGPDSRIKVPRGSRVIAGHGRALLPGLIDCHVHYCLDAGPDAIRTLEQDGPTVTAVKAVAHARATLEELRAGVEEAVRAGRRVAAHAHGAEGMKNALRAGVHSIEHGTLLDAEALDLLLKRRTFLVPTLSAIQCGFEHGKQGGMPDSALEKGAGMAEAQRQNFRKAVKAGVRIAMGTDAGTPFNHHGRNAQELRRMVQFGLTPMRAIEAATRSAATLLGLEQEIGTVEAGKQADLLVVKGNPLDDIVLLEEPARLEYVIQGGRVVKGNAE